MELNLGREGSGMGLNTRDVSPYTCTRARYGTAASSIACASDISKLQCSSFFQCTPPDSSTNSTVTYGTWDLETF